jgi:hypothetical protein
MSNSRKLESTAIEAVARRFSATWESDKGGSPGPYLAVDGKRIALEVVVLREEGLTRYGGITKPRLRFDKVALRLVRDLQVALRESVPDDRTLVITVTAPIWQSSKTVAVLVDEIRSRLARRTARLELNETINGNQIRARLVKDASGRASKVVGFVHNPDPDHPELLMGLTESLLRHIGAAEGKRAPKKSANDRWLVLACVAAFPHAETYRHVYSQLAIATDYRKILLVLSGGRVELLAG